VSDDSAPKLPGLEPAWATLTDQGYLLTDEQEIGLAGLRENFLKKYFTDSVLRHDPGDLPVDRKRARDVISYGWHGDELRIREHETIVITNRAGIPGKREHKRVLLVDDPWGDTLARTFLRLVPPRRRQPEGTFGINLFRTFSDVVTTPHHDHEQFVFLYVLDRVGDGAESYLYRPEDVDEDGQVIGGPVVKHQLNPGEILIFEDRLFKHGATPLVPPAGGKAQRDVLVCTVDYRTTYLERAA
jgi:2-oxoglutarate-Fe(II)-dependent dioxygenase family protein